MSIVLLILAGTGAALNNDSTFAAAWLSTIPGAFGDPLRGLLIISPAFTTPAQRRYDPIAMGSPHTSIDYTVNGCQLPIAGEAASPFFFYGYRSWFNSVSNLRFTADPSRVPIEYGFSTGPLISAATSDCDTALSVKLQADNYDAAAGCSAPLGQTAAVSCGGRLGYNFRAIRKWVDPYTSSGDISYDSPLYGDYSLSAGWRPSSRLAVKTHFLGTFQKLDNRGGANLSLNASQRYNTNSIGTNIHAEPSAHLLSTTMLSITHNGGKSTAMDMFEDNRSILTLSLTEKLCFPLNAYAAPYAGIDARRNFGTIVLRIPTASNTISDTGINDRRYSCAPFIGLSARPLARWDFDVGVRYDTYDLINAQYGSFFAVSPRSTLVDSVTGNLTYRAITSVELPGAITVSLSSGTFSQSPSIDELCITPSLHSSKSSRHSLSCSGALPFGTGYALGGYYLEMWDIPVMTASGDLLQSSDPTTMRNDGGLRAYGLTAQCDYSYEKSLNAMIAYTLCRNRFRNGDSGGWQRSDNDRRHKANVLVQGKLPFGFEWGIDFLFTTGAPYTPVMGTEFDATNRDYRPVFGSLNSNTGEPYTNLSIRVGYANSFGRLSFGAFIEVRDILGTARENDLYVYNYDFTETRSLHSDLRAIAVGIEVGL